MVSRHTQALPGSADRLLVTFGYRGRTRCLAIPRLAAIVLFLLIPVAALLYLAATCYFIFHDDVLSALMRHQAQMQYAYEDRIAGLRRDVENADRRAAIAAADFATRLHGLAQRQDEIDSRTALIAAFAAHLRDMGLVAGASIAGASSVAADTSGSDAPSDAAAPAANVLATQAPAQVDGKPHPAGFDLRLQDGANSPARPAPTAPISYDPGPSNAGLLHDLTFRYDRTDAADLAILKELEDPADRLNRDVRATLAALGLSAARFQPAARGLPHDESAGMGGPFVPLSILTDGSHFAGVAAQLQNALATAQDLKSLLPHIPLEAPLDGALEVTSPFGPRIDPFLGRPALHTGVDLRGAYGTAVHATAPGRVIFAGMMGGYGNLVEINNGNGLSTRYAHLSSIDVVPGETVAAGAILGHIGETGRATGPHLHYEVRIDGRPVDPERFLRAGIALRAEMAAL